MSRHYVKREVRRREIAAAALGAIDELGIAGCTTRSIAARVEITEGSIFRHFASKQEILLEAMDILEEELFPELQAEPDPDPLQQLGAFFISRARLLGGDSSLGRLAFSDQLAATLGEAGRERMRAWQQRSRDMLQRWLGQLQAAGDLRSALPVSELVPIVQGRLMAFAMERIRQPRVPADLDARIDAAWAALQQLLFTREV